MDGKSMSTVDCQRSPVASDSAIHAGMGLGESREFFDLIMASIPNLFFVKDSAFRIVMANPAFLALYPEEMQDKVVGYTTLEEYDEDQASAFLYHDRKAFEEGESTTLETIDFPDGKRRDLITRKIRFAQSGGTPFIVGISTDITEVLQGQKALAESEERYELAVAGSAAGVWDWDVKNQSIFWSEKIQQQLGLRTAQGTFTSESFAALFHPDDRVQAGQKIQDHLHSGLAYDAEHRIQTQQGDRWVRVCGQAIWDQDGAPTRMAGSLEDVTEQIKAQDTLAQSLQRLDEFAHIVSHDLREPLRGIGNLVEFFKEDFGDALPPGAVTRLDQIATLKERADSLVVELLSYSKLVHSEKRMSTVGLTATLHDAIRMLPTEARESIYVLDRLPRLLCEPVAVRQLFQNLITNGLRYNLSDTKRIEIGMVKPTLRQTNTPDVFYVRDNGIGIPKEKFEHVFKIFRRLHHNSAFDGGTGAGLTFAKRIVERHGGRIWIESSEGQGSTFFFTLAPDIHHDQAIDA